MMTTQELENYWSNRYANQQTGWDIGYPAIPIAAYCEQLSDKKISILIPGAGNAYEAEHLFLQGFQNVTVLDISAAPLQAFQQRLPEFPKGQLIQENFFTFEGQFDLVIEQTFFCSFEPTVENRTKYAAQMSKLLKPGGKLVGLWFKHPLHKEAKRPFGGSKAEYLSYLTPFFKARVFEDCYNSIPPRQGNELFGIFINK